MKRTIEVMLVGAIVLDVAYWSIWFTSRGGGAIEAGIVAVTLLFSLTALRFAWTRRDALLAGDPI